MRASIGFSFALACLGTVVSVLAEPSECVAGMPCMSGVLLLQKTHVHEEAPAYEEDAATAANQSVVMKPSPDKDTYGTSQAQRRERHVFTKDCINCSKHLTPRQGLLHVAITPASSRAAPDEVAGEQPRPVWVAWVFRHWHPFLPASASNAIVCVWIASLVLAVILLKLFLVWLVLRIAGEWLRRYIEEIDRDLIGVDILIETSWINPLCGIVYVENLKICNPKGYKEPYLLHVDRLTLDIDMLSLIRSGCNTIEIERLLFEGVHIHYEKRCTKSNVDDIVHHFNYGEGDTLLPSSGMEYAVHKVSFSGIRISASAWIKGTIDMEDVRYEDFQNEHGTAVITKLVRKLMRGFLIKVKAKATNLF